MLPICSIVVISLTPTLRKAMEIIQFSVLSCSNIHMGWNNNLINHQLQNSSIGWHQSADGTAGLTGKCDSMFFQRALWIGEKQSQGC